MKRKLIPARAETPLKGATVETPLTDYQALIDLKSLLLTHGKALDEAHDGLSKVLEEDVSDDDLRDAAITMCNTLNAFYEARKAALGPDAVLPLTPMEHEDSEAPDHVRG